MVRCPEVFFVNEGRCAADLCIADVAHKHVVRLVYKAKKRGQRALCIALE